MCPKTFFKITPPYNIVSCPVQNTTQFARRSWSMGRRFTVCTVRKQMYKQVFFYILYTEPKQFYDFRDYFVCSKDMDRLKRFCELFSFSHSQQLRGHTFFANIFAKTKHFLKPFLPAHMGPSSVSSTQRCFSPIFSGKLAGGLKAENVRVTYF